MSQLVNLCRSALEDDPWPEEREPAMLDIEIPEAGYIVARIIDKKNETRAPRSLRA
jgi:hypothetical protein